MRLLRLIRDAPGAVEADLARFYALDLAGLWRGDLSLRRLAVLVRHLPQEAAVHGVGGAGGGWSVGDYLAADLVHAMTGHPHPADPRVRRAEEEKRARLAQAQARAERRRARLAQDAPTRDPAGPEKERKGDTGEE